MKNTEIMEEKVKFVLQQAKEHLVRTLITSEQIEYKAVVLLGFSLTIMIGLVAYLITQHQQLRFLFLPIILYIGALLICSICLFLVLIPANYYGEGSTPKRLLRDDVFLGDNLHFITQEVESYTEKIENNAKKNERKVVFLTVGIYIFMIAPILSGIIMLISFFCRLTFLIF